MNYKPITVEKINELMELYPEYSMGEVLYAILRSKTLKGRPDGIKLGWLMEIEDKDFYTAIERAIELEKED